MEGLPPVALAGDGTAETNEPVEPVVAVEGALVEKPSSNNSSTALDDTGSCHRSTITASTTAESVLSSAIGSCAPPPPVLQRNNEGEKWEVASVASTANSMSTFNTLSSSVNDTAAAATSGKVKATSHKQPDEESEDASQSTRGSSNKSDDDKSSIIPLVVETKQRRPRMLDSRPRKASKSAVDMDAYMDAVASGRRAPMIPEDGPMDVDEYMRRLEKSKASKRDVAVPGEKKTPAEPKTQQRAPKTADGNKKKDTKGTIARLPTQATRKPPPPPRSRTARAASKTTASDAKVPPPAIRRSSSQEIAIHAVLGKEKSAEKNAFAEVLTDAELPAVVPPTLRRHGSSTPGAFREGGGDGTGTATTGEVDIERNDDGSDCGTDTPEPPELEPYTSGATVVTATLVGSSDMSETFDAENRKPVLAHAEPVVKNRRLLAYISIWGCLALIAVGVLGILVVVFEHLIGGEQESHILTAAPTPAPTPALQIALDQNTTTAGESTAEFVRIPMISSHAVLWGKISTCDDDSYFDSHELEISCGGALDIVFLDNAICSEVDSPENPGYNNPSIRKCRMIAREDPLDADFFAQQAVARVGFTCSGSSFIDRAAAIHLPRMPVGNCTSVRGRQFDRRFLDETSGSSATTATAESPVKVQVRGGAANFAALGRYCTDEATQWKLWHEFYICERGSSVWLTLMGAVTTAPQSVVTNQELFGHNATDALSGLKSGGKGLLGNVLDMVLGGGGRRRRLRRLNNFVSGFLDFADISHFCYQHRECTCEGVGCSCDINLPMVQMSNGDVRPQCFYATEDAPEPSMMKEMAEIELDPADMMNRVVWQNIQVDERQNL